MLKKCQSRSSVRSALAFQSEIFLRGLHRSTDRVPDIRGRGLQRGGDRAAVRTRRGDVGGIPCWRWGGGQVGSRVLGCENNHIIRFGPRHCVMAQKKALGARKTGSGALCEAFRASKLPSEMSSTPSQAVCGVSGSISCVCVSCTAVNDSSLRTSPRSSNGEARVRDAIGFVFPVRRDGRKVRRRVNGGDTARSCGLRARRNARERRERPAEHRHVRGDTRSD